MERAGRELPRSNQILASAKSGVSILTLIPKSDEVSSAEPKSSEAFEVERIFFRADAIGAVWSDFGNRLALLKDTSSTIEVLDSDALSEVQKTISLTGPIKRYCFSPQGSFIIAYAPNNGPPERGVQVFDLKSETPEVMAWSRLRLHHDVPQWPSFMWSENESFCFKLSSEGVSYYQGDLSDFEKGGTLIPSSDGQPSAIAVSVELKNGSVNLAMFSEVQRDRPAVVRIVNVSLDGTKEVNRKAFYQAQSVKMQWNSTGSALLITSFTDVDKEGGSYYGTSSLYYVEASVGGKTAQLVGPSNNSGPVSDVQWSPSINEFLAVYGRIPSTITMFDGKSGEPTIQFGVGRRNHIRFNPFGRFILVAGFGNLAGEFDVWDKNKKKVIGKATAPCSITCEWSPDGRYLLSATTSPRMRIDNQIKVFRYNGELLLHQKFVKEDPLYSAAWRPFPRGTFKDRGVSKGRVLASTTAETPTAGTGEAPKAYRPPGSSEAFQEKMRALRGAQSSSTTATAVTPSSGVVGLQAPMSKCAKRNAAKRAKKALAKSQQQS